MHLGSTQNNCVDPKVTSPYPLPIMFTGASPPPLLILNKVSDYGAINFYQAIVFTGLSCWPDSVVYWSRCVWAMRASY